MAEKSNRNGWARHASACLGAFAAGLLLSGCAVAQAQIAIPETLPPGELSWYGDPSAPNISGVWVRAEQQPEGSASAEGWLPWPPPLTEEYAEIWQERVAADEAGTREDEPIAACLPPGMPRFMTGMTPPMLILQTPGRVMMYRDGSPVRRIWVDGRELPDEYDIEEFFNGNSIGRYEGETLVTTVAGFKDQPIDATGIPHSTSLTIEERVSRVDEDTLRVEVTLTDPEAFTAPMRSVVIYKLHDDPLWEPREFICTPRTNYHPEIIVR